jgi:hypothetical protein
MPHIHHDMVPRGTFYEQKLRMVCSTCKRRGRLWLGGKDYVECPHCDGTGVIELVEARVEPPKIYPCYARN